MLEKILDAQRPGTRQCSLEMGRTWERNPINDRELEKLPSFATVKMSEQSYNPA